MIGRALMPPTVHGCRSWLALCRRRSGARAGGSADVCRRRL